MPSVREVGPTRSCYFNRKGFPAIIIQTFVSSELEFLFVSARTAGSTHDWIAFSSTSLASRFANGDLPPRYFVVADAAYVYSEQVLTPWPGSNLPPAKDSFNYHLSLMRQVRV